MLLMFDNISEDNVINLLCVFINLLQKFDLVLSGMIINHGFTIIKPFYLLILLTLWFM